MPITIDVEPTWVELCNMVKNTSNQSAVRKLVDELKPAAKVADIVRQAQKSGAKSVTFTFDEGGVSYDVKTDNKFTVGMCVIVTPQPNDEFFQFGGTIVSFRGKWISVVDQDDNVWDVYESQLEVNE